LGLCVVWAMQLQTTHYRSWASESDSRAVFQQIVLQHEPGSKQRLRVKATWWLAPGLNFYRDVFKADFVERIDRESRRVADPDLYAVAAPEAGGTPPDEPVKELYRGGTSGTVVAAPAGR